MGDLFIHLIFGLPRHLDPGFLWLNAALVSISHVSTTAAYDLGAYLPCRLRLSHELAVAYFIEARFSAHPSQSLHLSHLVSTAFDSIRLKYYIFLENSPLQYRGYSGTILLPQRLHSDISGGSNVSLLTKYYRFI